MVSDLLALCLQLLHQHPISGIRQHPAQVDDLLNVDVLALRTCQDDVVAADLYEVLAAMAQFDRSSGFQQRQRGVPLHVAARWLMEELLESMTLVVFWMTVSLW